MNMKLKDVLKAIDDEPEMPGEPPQEMVDGLMEIMKNKDLGALIEMCRIGVRLTKQGIKERVLDLSEKENGGKVLDKLTEEAQDLGLYE